MYQIMDKIGGHYNILPVPVPSVEKPEWYLFETNSSTVWTEQENHLIKVEKMKSVTKMNNVA
jgi:hypothetical protein